MLLSVLCFDIQQCLFFVALKGNTQLKNLQFKSMNPAIENIRFFPITCTTPTPGNKLFQALCNMSRDPAHAVGMFCAGYDMDGSFTLTIFSFSLFDCK